MTRFPGLNSDGVGVVILRYEKWNCDLSPGRKFTGTEVFRKRLLESPLLLDKELSPFIDDKRSVW